MSEMFWLMSKVEKKCRNEARTNSSRQVQLFLTKRTISFQRRKIGIKNFKPEAEFQNKVGLSDEDKFFCTNDKSDKFDKERMVSFLVFLGLIYLFLDRLVSLTFRP